MVSQELAGGEEGKEEHRQASPMDIPSICVLDGGQMGDSPSIRTDQRVGMEIMGTDEASVDGCESR